jgi:hypothetical protein
MLAAISSARSQLLVQSGNSFGLYNFNGTVINSNFITSGLSYPQGVVVSGTNIFVADTHQNSVKQYNLDGTSANPALITGIYGQAVMIVGTNLYVTENNGIGKYSTTGATNNRTLITSFVADGMANDGTNIYLTSLEGNPGVVAKFNLDGTPVNKAFISGFSSGPSGIAISGSNIYVADFFNGTIGKYDLATGAAVNVSLVSGLYHPNGLLIIGGLLYVECYTNVGVYGLDGSTKNASLIAMPALGENNYGIASMPPLATQNVAVQSNVFSFTVNGFSNQVVVVEASSSLDAPNWTPIQTNTLGAGSTLITDAAWTNYPKHFYRLQLQ